MGKVSSFAPISSASARVLIVGSMPGEASLKANQYYAHPHNSFWKIMAALTGVPPTAPYKERTAGLVTVGIALWDVLESCTRLGSLDAKIERDSVKANDFALFFVKHKLIELICFNGATAEQEYKRHVLPLKLQPDARRLRLPSTSPAHASLSFEKKLAAWRVAVMKGKHHA